MLTVPPGHPPSRSPSTWPVSRRMWQSVAPLCFQPESEHRCLSNVGAAPAQAQHCRQAVSFCWLFTLALPPSPVGVSLSPHLPGCPVACLFQGLLEVSTCPLWAGAEAESCFCQLWRKMEESDFTSSCAGWPPGSGRREHVPAHTEVAHAFRSPSG